MFPPLIKPFAAGIDSMLRDPAPYLGLKWAFVTNDAALTMEGIPCRLALMNAGFRIIRLFSPEHGISATGADGEAQPDQRDPLTGIPVTSLYGGQWAPTAEQLAEVDAVLFDIPDIGCRFYTYLWTMSHVLEACAVSNKELYIADRRNPIGTLLERSEGPWLDEAHCSSFIGRWNIPLKHACTMGELARFFNSSRVPTASVHVIPIPGYYRCHASPNDHFRQTSPAIPDLETALLYPGTCLFEGVNINEGRGTDHPFTVFGAPWLNSKKLLSILESLSGKGWTAERHDFQAMTGPYAGERCNGIKLGVQDADTLLALRMGLDILKAIHLLHPSEFSERAYHTLANPDGKGHLDRLLGIKNSFRSIRNNEDMDTNVTVVWSSMMQKHLIYT